MNASGILVVRSDVSGARFSSATQLGPGWVSLELCGTVGAAAQWDLFRNGTKVVNAWTANTGTSPVGQVQIGDTAARTVTVNFDDVVVDRSPG